MSVPVFKAFFHYLLPKPAKICGVVFIILLMLGCISASAQNADGRFVDSLTKKLRYYGIKKQDGILYAHFDKTIYTNNDNVWFTAYLLNQLNSNKLNDVVETILVNDKTHQIALEKKFVMKAGLSFGKMELPDTLQAGNYSFILYNNELIKGKPINVFIQPVTIKSTTAMGYKAPAGVKPAKQIPATSDIPIVKFYPEGGNLSAGLISTIGWEIKDSIGNPYKTTGVLYKNGSPVDTMATNSYGMGRFKLRPDSKSNYEVKLLSPASKNAAYQLPRIITDRPVVTINNAVADDTVIINIKSPQLAKVFIVVHNYRELFFTIPFTANAAGRNIKIALTDIPRGIAEVTLLDSLKRPCAGRLFFAHYNKRSTLSINTDKPTYQPRQKVTMALNLKDADGKPVSGFVSIACVQANRLLLNKRTDIESYFYLHHELGALPIAESRMANTAADKAYLEDVLLIKGWRRYTWSELDKTIAADTLQQNDSLQFTGVITRFNKPLKKQGALVIMKDSTMSFLETNATGKFSFDNKDLFAADNRKLHLLAGGDRPEDYTITINDPYKKVSGYIAQNYLPKNYSTSTASNEPDDTGSLKGLEHTIGIKEVKIKASRDNALYGSKKTINACGDYVCQYGFLNCPMHVMDANNQAPVKGALYKVYDGTLSDQSEMFHNVMYVGCDTRKLEHTTAINGINYSTEFYPADYTQYNPPEPEYLSTIYWKHLYKITPGNATPISFYTGDINGDFKIVVQGITATGVIFGEKTISVEKP